MKIILKNNNVYVSSYKLFMDNEAIYASSIMPYAVYRDGSMRDPTIFIVYAVGNIVVGLKESPDESCSQE